MTALSTPERDWPRRARALLGHLVDFVLPPRCGACGVVVDRTDGLCAACWGEIGFIGDPMCVACGLPLPPYLDVMKPEEAMCGGCLVEPLPLVRHRSATAYGGTARRLVLAFKHGDRLDLAPMLAGWLERAGAALLAETDLIAPVPLHPNRLLVRRYNQSAELARALAQRSRVPVKPDLLLRIRSTPSQAGKSREGRARNVAGAFAVTPRHRDILAGKRVLLVDDVTTTGATLAACARVLHAAGAGQVMGLTLARVVPEDAS